jgi:DNA-binding transcriptional MerR regulator
MFIVAGCPFMAFLKSRVVADQLGISYYNLFELIRSKRLTPPEKDSSGDYVWTPADIERAREALAWRGRRSGSALSGSAPDQTLSPEDPTRE